MIVAPPFWLALLLAGGIALAASSARLLTRSGAIAAWLVGVIVFGLGGGKFAVPLLVFFLSSSLLSRVGRRRKVINESAAVPEAARDAGQVLANGGVAALIVVIYAMVVRRWPAYETRSLLTLYLAALATVNADTWATEIGKLSPWRPRALANWRRVAPGTSGAVTLFGLVASLAGAFLIAICARFTWRLDPVELVTVTWAGFLGSIADSLLGAGIQAQYLDPESAALVDRPTDPAATSRPERGLAFVNNDVVNLLSSVAGVVFAWALLRYGGALR